MKTNTQHYGDKDGLTILSYNAVFMYILTNRNYGKTWTFKKRAFRRAMKHGKKTIWLRMFKKEVKEASATFYNSKDLQKFCGIDIYDKQTNPNGNFKQIGNTFYYRTSPNSRWNWFLKIYALNDADAVRSADDIDVDTIVFDEFTKTVDKYRRYHGNIVNDFVDIFFSAKREHQIRCIFLGNKESINNPFFTYFGIKPLPATFNGIRTYRNGSIAVQQLNNKADTVTDYGKQVAELLKGTAYGNYIYNDEYKTQMAFRPRKTPPTATLYCQLIMNSQAIKISVQDGFYYVNQNVVNTKPIYCDHLYNKYAVERVLVKRNKRFFVAFINALADNRVYYDNAKTHEAIQPFLMWLTI